MRTKDLISENVKKIAEDFPMCITEIEDKDGNLKKVIDFEKLKEVLTGDIRDTEEPYVFTWAGKSKALENAFTSIDINLRPVVEDSVNFYDTNNIYIEGDNLEVLKILQLSYFEKVKMIYIDPPYNTGHDFIYDDDFKQSEEEYDEETGIYDDEDNRLYENRESNGRFHSAWCSMIYSRLLLARNLLRPDGVIFISIDDNEVASLRKICDEVFGEDNFVAIFPWRKRTAKSDVPFGVSQDYESIICYAKTDKFKACMKGKERKYYESEDFPNRPWRIHDLTTQRTASERPNSYFTIIDPKNGKEYPAQQNRTWCITKDTFKQYYKENRIVFPDDYPFLKISRPVFRYWKDDDMKKENFGKVAVSTKLPENIGMSQDGTKEIAQIFLNKVFSFPKPISLIKYLIEVSNFENYHSNDIILDFFSGSATTAHAVMQLNAEDGGNRRYIMVQIPEKCDEKSEAFKAGYKNICEIGKERIRRAGKKIKEETNADIDYGFKVFKVDSSYLKENIRRPLDEIRQEDLQECIENIREDRKPLDLLYAIILDFGKQLTLPIKVEKVGDFTLYNVSNYDMLACFDKNISNEVKEYMAKKEPNFAIFRDNSFKDSVHMTNVAEYFKVVSKETKIRII